MLFGLNLASAQDTARVEITEWAGGVCCSYGTIYTITFEAREWEIDSMELDVDGSSYTLNCLESMKVGPGKYRVQFSMSSNQRIEAYESQLNYQGIDPKRIKPINPPYELFRIYYSNGKIRNAPIELTRNMIAYP